MAISDEDKRALTGQQVAEAGLDGWRKVLDRLTVRYRTGGFSAGAALVSRIAEVADEADHHPDVDLRYPHVTVSLMSHDVDAITERDLRLARRISALAADAGATPTPQAPDVWEVCLDTGDIAASSAFWSAMLGHREGKPDDLRDPAARLPHLWFQESTSTAADRQRWHLDINVPHDAVQERIEAALAAGGRLVSAEHAPAFWVLADPDGNLGCLCTWQSRD